MVFPNSFTNAIQKTKLEKMVNTPDIPEIKNIDILVLVNLDENEMY